MKIKDEREKKGKKVIDAKLEVCWAHVPSMKGSP
jgi:hypothetical protein